MGDDSITKKKKAAIIGVSSLLLVAAVVGSVTYGVTHGEKEADGSSGGVDDKVQTSSKAVEAMCQPTDYKEACEKSLSGAKNTTDPKELIKAAFDSTVDSIGQVIKNSALLKEAAKDPRTSQALENCKSHLDNSIDDIKRSFDKISTFDVNKFDDYIINIKTWLSAAITYQQTCLDEFDGVDGDTGKKMRELLKNTTELSSNGLAMVTELSQILTSLQIPGISRRLLYNRPDEDYFHDKPVEGKGRRLLYNRPDEDYFHDKPVEGKGRRLLYNRPDADYFLDKPVEGTGRRLLQANPAPNAVVAQDGSGKFRTIMDAIRSIPNKNNQPFVLLIKAGIYKEYVLIPKKVNNVVLIGEGPLKTKITGNKNFIDGTGTFQTATVAVEGEGFVAKDITFENSAGAEKHQAVALRVSADKAVFYNCQIDAFQDTLYAHSGRQFYRDCTISGTIDFIFGDGAAVFQNCKMIIRRPMDNQDCMVTAQGRTDSRGIGGIVIQNSQITADPAFYAMKPQRKAFLGRPWKQFSRTIIMQSFIDRAIVPEGWSVWNTSDHGLHTSYYAEYLNKGPGADTSRRVTWKGIQKLTPQTAESFTLGPYVNGDEWVKPTGVPFITGMLKA